MNDPHIVSNPTVMMGKPVIAGTRITVELILDKLGHGESIEQLVDSHPHLTHEAVLAALRYSSRSLGRPTTNGSTLLRLAVVLLVIILCLLAWFAYGLLSFALGN